jgi:hypothetical protein
MMLSGLDAAMARVTPESAGGSAVSAAGRPGEVAAVKSATERRGGDSDAPRDEDEEAAAEVAAAVETMNEAARMLPRGEFARLERGEGFAETPAERDPRSSLRVVAAAVRVPGEPERAKDFSASLSAAE